MKDERKQCKKHHESTIGKIIYGFLLFLPLFAIGSTCLYAIFNHNARDSFSGTHTYKETVSVEAQTDLISGRNYYTLTNLPYTNGSTTFKGFYNIQNLILSTNNEQLFNTNDYQYTFYAITPYATNTITIFGQNIQKTTDNEIELTQITSIINNDIRIDMLIFDNPISLGNLTNFVQNLKYDSYYVNTKLNDVFYYAIDSVQNSAIFNWTTNTGIYTVLNNTCNSLGITTTFVPLLLAYWLIISVVYFLYDIVLIILNILHRKIHEVQESI